MNVGDAGAGGEEGYIGRGVEVGVDVDEEGRHLRWNRGLKRVQC